ncbi:hypothetical protein GCM10011316_29220 [Roseibium aquae]|uniref:Uncharacterized protein n=1 Tax=Roseibium aquae TaxID=1323746 RepID=A0A916X2Q3_9HYPH|nr:hypothetical protein [Roseibium aquae]GGB55312.1 hypothetical protein GCM10011316_29220 [Roseibium aquae]
MPIQLELRVTTGKPVYRGHDHYWSVIRDLGKGGRLFTFEEIDLRCNDRDGKCISDYVIRLLRAGFLEIAETRDHLVTRYASTNKSTRPENVYRLLKRPSATPILNRDGSPGKLGQGQIQLWTAIRSLSAFDVNELAIAASTVDVPVRAKSAQAYIYRLELAGYLQVLRKGKAATPGIWRLNPAMNTGPKPPKILRSKLVYDANLKQVMGPVVAEEVAA